MIPTNTCPCCGNSLLRHAGHGKVYWFCTSCRLEVPLVAISCKTLEAGIKREIPVKA